ncbi:MAG: hypothetical protein U0325_30120 [Polyangiales bacterium]
MRASSIAFALTLSLSPLTARAQDVWSSPAPGIRVLRRVSHGVALRAVTADLTNPEVRPAVVTLDEGERRPARRRARAPSWASRCRIPRASSPRPRPCSWALPCPPARSPWARRRSGAPWASPRREGWSS